MAENVVDITVVPGMPGSLLGDVIGASGIGGVVPRTFGQGNLPAAEPLHRALREAVAAGKVFVNVTQCAKGRVDMQPYESARRLAEIGVVRGEVLTPQAVFTKLSWLLGTGLPAEEVRARMAPNERGEMRG